MISNFFFDYIFIILKKTASYIVYLFASALKKQLFFLLFMKNNGVELYNVYYTAISNILIEIDSTKFAIRGIFCGSKFFHKVIVQTTSNNLSKLTKLTCNYFVQT
jgi:hypothetical protein